MLKTRPKRAITDSGKKVPGVRALGMDSLDPVDSARRISSGFSFGLLQRLQQSMDLPWDELADLVGIAPRTLSRREREGRLRPDESDRVFRAAEIFDLTVDLFDGDVPAAMDWLETPQTGLGGEIPLRLATTGFGARAVENLIGRLQHGVFT